MLALGHGEDINVKISLKNIDFNAEMNWFPYIFLCWTCRQNWQKQNTDSYYSIVSITFPLSLLFFSHILFSYLIIKPWNKRVLMESKKCFWFSFLYMEYVLRGIVSSLLRSASCNLLCFPWLSSCLHSPAPPPNFIFFNISSAPFPHYQHSPSLYVTHSEIKSHGGGRNKDDNEIRRKTGWACAWGRWRWWNVKWCSEGSFCSLSHQ